MIKRKADWLPKGLVCAFDCETTGLNPRKDKVIGFSIATENEAHYFVHLEWNGVELVEIIPFEDCVTLLKSLGPVVMHNASFDVRFIEAYFGVKLDCYFDTMIAAHLIDENKTVGLKDVAARYYGIDAKEEQTILKEHLKAKGAAKDFYRADTAILGKYAEQDAVLTWRLFETLRREVEKQELSTIFYSELMPLLNLVVVPMQQRGVRVDMAKLYVASAEITSTMSNLERDILSQIKCLLGPFYDWFYNKNYPIKTRGKVATLAKGRSVREAQELAHGDKEPFNILSKDHLKRLFFTILKEKPLSTTDKGNAQVESDFLEAMAGKYEWAKQIIVYNKLQKINGTYIQRLVDEVEEGVFYPDYHMTRTTSGRLSGDAQQLPRPIEDGHPDVVKFNNQIREFFIARSGMILVDDDYESLEPRVFASVAGDDVLINMFAKGHDFYSTIAIQVEGLKDVSADKSAPNYLGKVNKAKRQTAKAYSLGIAYGLDAFKLHKDLNISKSDAERLVRGYLTGFPQLAKNMLNLKTQLCKLGYVTNMFGRRRRQPDAVATYNELGDDAFDSLQLWKRFMDGDEPNRPAYLVAKETASRLKSARNNAYNFPIQSVAAHLINRASVAIVRAFRAANLDAHIIAQIHDELIVECKESDKDLVGALVRDCMENTTKIKVPLTAVPSFGYNFKEAKGG